MKDPSKSVQMFQRLPGTADRRIDRQNLYKMLFWFKYYLNVKSSYFNITNRHSNFINYKNFINLIIIIKSKSWRFRKIFDIQSYNGRQINLIV